MPAFNEATTIGAVIDAISACPQVDAVIVVDDGSEDGTAAVAVRHGARLVSLPRNLGKGAAVAAGLRATRADVLVFIDADLIGLRPEHVTALVEPVASGRAAMTVGVFEGGRAATDLAQAVAPFLSGQRAVRRDLLQSLPDLDQARYGVEMALTMRARRAGAAILAVELAGLTHRMKEEKAGLWRGFLWRLRMYWDIVKVASGRRNRIP